MMDQAKQRERILQTRRWLLYLVGTLSAFTPVTSGRIYAAYHEAAKQGEACPLTERTLAKHLHDLSREGWIVRELVYNGRHGITSHYRIPPNVASQPTRPSRRYE